MLYQVAHYLRDRIPIIWSLVDHINSWLFKVRYSHRLCTTESNNIRKYESLSGLRIVPMREISAEELEKFFAAQPSEAFIFFKPHAFDARSIKKLQKLESFLAYVFYDGSDIVGYCFIRGFFIGKGFRGRMVDINHRGQGISTLMNRMINEVGFGIGLKLFETVSKNNVASYRSALSASKIIVLKEINKNELYLEIVNSIIGDNDTKTDI